MRLSQSSIRPSKNIDMEVSPTLPTERTFKLTLCFVSLDCNYTVVCVIGLALPVDG